jgi:acyl-CoA synthetase (NDP forming)
VITAYTSLHDALYSLAELYRYHNEIKNRKYEDFHLAPEADRSRAENILAGGLAAGVRVLNEQALDVVESYGIPAVRQGFAENVEEALRLADLLGYPVVMKIASPEITHKSDSGGVRLNIKSGQELRRAYAEMIENVRTRAPGAGIRGVLIQTQIAGGTEVILGGKQDPQFGPVLVYGLGGVFTELIHDVAFRIAPLTEQEAMKMIRETKSFKILSGARGQKPGDINGLAGCIVRLGALLCEHPEIAEVDINPLLVGPDGCLALDARIITGA